jgi:hypothetical protein
MRWGGAWHKSELQSDAPRNERNFPDTDFEFNTHSELYFELSGSKYGRHMYRSPHRIQITQIMPEAEPSHVQAATEKNNKEVIYVVWHVKPGFFNPSHWLVQLIILTLEEGWTGSQI